MNIELERFITLVQIGSFTKASEKLFITQPALSLSIQRLEKELGVRLFRSVAKHIHLTSEGELIYEIALGMQRLWHSAKDIKTTYRALSKYRFGLYDNAALKLSKYFQKKLEKDRFEIGIDRSLSLLKSLNSGIFDVVICVVPEDLKFFPNVILVHSFSELLVPVSEKKWREEVSQIPFILYNKGSETQRYIDMVFLEHGIKPKVIVESTDPSFMRQLALGNCGVAILPRNIVEQELKRKKLFIQRLPFQFRRNVGVFIGKNSTIKEDKKVLTEIVKYL